MNRKFYGKREERHFNKRILEKLMIKNRMPDKAGTKRRLPTGKRRAETSVLLLLNKYLKLMKLPAFPS